MNVKLLSWLFLLIGKLNCKKVDEYPGIQTESCGIRKMPTNSVSTRIVNGTDAVLGEFPWMVAIQSQKALDDGNFVDEYCGGALITDRFVVTAANCLDFFGFLPNHTWVIAGTIDMSRDTHFRSVRSVIIHESFNMSDPMGRLFDIALVELSEKLSPLLSDESDHKSYVINSICLPEKGLAFNGKERAVFSGFGEFKEHPHPDNLQNFMLKKAEYTIEDSPKCEQNRLCGYESEHMSCFRDTGSPLVKFDGERAVLIGILTTVGNESSDCRKNWQYFTRVSVFENWIYSHIRNVTEIRKQEKDEQNSPHSTVLFLFVILIVIVLIGSGSLCLIIYALKKKREIDESQQKSQKSEKSKTSLENTTN